jgi:hypothetical protein
LSNNIDIFPWIDEILTNFDQPKIRGTSRYCRIKPMTFEYDRLKGFGTMKFDFEDFFDSPIIIGPISAGRKNSGIRGSSIGPTFLMCCRVKAISIHVISSK